MTNIEQILGNEAESLLSYHCKTVPKEMLHLPGPDFIDRVMVSTDRRPKTSLSWRSKEDVMP
jgi:class I fructose-bisphosphate aldolase